MMIPPWVFVACGVVWLLALALGWALAAIAARADREDELRQLSVPRRLASVERPVAVPPKPRPGRDGQQERATRAALYCVQSVDAAPVRCPVSEAGG